MLRTEGQRAPGESPVTDRSAPSTSSKTRPPSPVQRFRNLSPRLSPATAVAALALGFVWRHFSRLPLRHTDLWGHLAYGRWIAFQGVPTFEPLIPGASASPFIDTAWLIPVVWFQCERFGGLLALQQLHAILVVAECAAACASGWRASRWVGGGIAAGVTWLAAGWFQIPVIRPQQSGMLCAGIVLWQLADRRRPLKRPLWLFPLFVLWAGLHGSFVIGWGHLICALAARIARILSHPNRRRPGIALRLARDATARRLALGLAAAVVATLFNPYGSRLSAEVFSIARHGNLADLTEWQPLLLASRQGKTFLAIWAACGLLTLLGIIRRRINSGGVRPTPPDPAGSSLGFLLAAVVLEYSNWCHPSDGSQWPNRSHPSVDLGWRE